MKATEYLDFTGAGLAEAIRKGAVSDKEAFDAARARCEVVNPQINAVVHTWYDEADAGLARGKHPVGCRISSGSKQKRVRCARPAG